MERPTLAMKRLATALLLLLAPALVRAQTTQQRIDSAVALYKAFNVEAARPILLNIISPGYLQQVSSQEKATAFKYLGASYAVLAQPDSAVNFFIAALDFDPFTDLDPNEFAESELGAFARAKASIFKVAVQPITQPKLLVPQSSSDTAAYVFRVITTQRANLHVELVLTTDTTKKEILYDGTNDGARGMAWRGLLSATGEFAPPGIYQLVARSAPSNGQPQVQTMSFKIEHVFEPLEDTLPSLDPARQLLPPRISPAAPWLDFAKGFALAAVSLGVPLALDRGDIDWTLHAGVSALVGLASGSASLYFRRKNPQISANVAENTRRQRERDQFNAQVRQRNANRIAQTLLIISPVTALGQ